MPDSTLPLAYQAVTALREQADRHGFELPDLAVNVTAEILGVAGVHLGDATAEAILYIANRLAVSPVA